MRPEDLELFRDLAVLGAEAALEHVDFCHRVKVGLHDAFAGAEAGNRTHLEPVVHIIFQIQGLTAQINLETFVDPVHGRLVVCQSTLTGARSRAAVVDTDVGIGLSLRIGLVAGGGKELARADLVDRTCRTKAIHIGDFIVVAGAKAIKRLPQQITAIQLIVDVAIGGINLGALQEALALLC